MKCADFENKTAYEAIELAEKNSLEMDQNWENETTMIIVEDGEIAVSGCEVMISRNRVSNEDIKEVYFMLKERIIHPAGQFDKGGRWWAEHDDLISTREPSRAWPYSQMTACRTLKYVKAVAEKFKPTTKEELIKLV